MSLLCSTSLPVRRPLRSAHAAMSSPHTAAAPCALCLQPLALPARFSARAGLFVRRAPSALVRCSAAQSKGSDLDPASRASPAAPLAQPALGAGAPVLLGTSAALWLLTELPALAEAAAAGGATDFAKGGFAKESYYVTLGLFLLSLPGLWSQIKRAPKAKYKRKTYEVDGPGRPGAPSLQARAGTIFAYFKKYNYEVKETGDTITWVGNYKASRGQAAALTFYVFCGLASTALVLSIAAPFGGNAWYGLTGLSPLAWAYYMQRGTRQETVKVKMVTADDDSTTDIMIEGDIEEIERFRKELQFQEKGMVYVKGLLES